jgi:hypothetical protein
MKARHNTLPSSSKPIPLVKKLTSIQPFHLESSPKSRPMAHKNISYQRLGRKRSTLNPEAKNASSSSIKSFPLLFRNSSVLDDIEKLESLTSRNVSAQHDWLSIEQRIIEISTKRKLEPIIEADENRAFHRNNSVEYPQRTMDLLQKYDMKFMLRPSERIKSYDFIGNNY